MPVLSSRRAATVLALCAVAAGVLSVLLAFWVAGQTDHGLLCDAAPGGPGDPWACHVYDAPFWVFGLAVVAGLAALVAFVDSVVRRRSRASR